MRIYVLYYSVGLFGSSPEIQYHTLMLNHLFKQTIVFRNASVFLNNFLFVFLLVRCLFIIVVLPGKGKGTLCKRKTLDNIDLNQVGVQRF